MLKTAPVIVKITGAFLVGIVIGKPSIYAKTVFIVTACLENNPVMEFSYRKTMNDERYRQEIM